jgi:hypothetical protein
MLRKSLECMFAKLRDNLGKDSTTRMTYSCPIRGELVESLMDEAIVRKDYPGRIGGKARA